MEVTITGKALVSVSSDKPPEEFNSFEEFYAQSNHENDELNEWDIDSINKVVED